MLWWWGGGGGGGGRREGIGEGIGILAIVRPPLYKVTMLTIFSSTFYSNTK